jgi:hypothetical protein
MVYGILLESIRDAIKEKYGVKIWIEIEEALLIDGSTLLSKKMYPDILIYQILGALVSLREGSGDSEEDYMQFFGNKITKFL